MATQTQKQEILNDLDELYEDLENAYQIAGNLRDAFTTFGDDQFRGQLKEYCNKIRGNISELQQFRSLFTRIIKL